jgi:hypothetical protein
MSARADLLDEKAAASIKIRRLLLLDGSPSPG